MKIHNALQTNGTLLDEHGVEFNVLCTVHAANQDHPLEVYRFFRDELKTHFIQFIPTVERTTPDILPLANDEWHAQDEKDRPLYTQSGSKVTKRSINGA